MTVLGVAGGDGTGRGYGIIVQEVEHDVLRAGPDSNKSPKGWLDKKGRIMKTWRRRWVVLRSSKLEYFVDQDCTRKKGELILTPDTRILSRDGRRHHHKFSIWTGDRLLHCSAYNTDDREDWINVLENTIKKLQPVKATKTSPEKKSGEDAVEEEKAHDTPEVNDDAVDFVHELGMSLRDLPNIDEIR